MKRVLVLGATGFIGSAIVRALAQQNDTSVIAGARRPGRAAMPAGVEVRACDVEDPTSLARAIDGATHVVDCVMGANAAMVAASRNVADLAASRGIKRVLSFSSCAVYGDTRGRLDETTPLGAPSDGYAEAKAECERILRDSAGRGVAATILRPGCVYGPGSDQWTGRIARLLASRRLGDLGARGDGTANLIFVDDVVAAALAGLDLVQPGTEVFNLADPDPATWNFYLMAFARELGAKPIRRIPAWQLKLDGKLLSPALKIAQILQQRLNLPTPRLADPLTPSLLRLFAQEVSFDPDKTDRLLQIPRTPLLVGLAKSTAWFKRHAR